MPARKRAEIIRWFAEGRTQAWMAEEYRRKYGIDTGAPMFGNFRARCGLDRRLARDDQLIPWSVQREHRWNRAVLMLRHEARRRAGHRLPATSEQALDNWLEVRARTDTVVAYDPDAGFSYVPREPDDSDLIRAPSRGLTRRRNRDRGRHLDPVPSRAADRFGSHSADPGD